MFSATAVRLFFFAAAVCPAAEYSAPAAERPANANASGTVLPGGRLLTPAGSHVLTGPGTFGLAINKDGKALASVDGGPNSFSITLLHNADGGWKPTRLRTATKGSSSAGEDDWRSVFMGVAFGGHGELYVSEGNSGRVRVVDGSTGRRLRVYNLNSGGFRDTYTGDLALDTSRQRLYVVDQANFRVVSIDVARNRIASSTRVGRLPFALALSPDCQRLYVTNLGMFEYQPIPGADRKRARETGLSFPPFGFPSPDAVAGATRQTESGAVRVPGLGQPNAVESNSVAILDISGRVPKLLAYVPTGLPFGGESSGGSSPSGVAATRDAIYVSNGHNDSISVIDAKTLSRLPDIPLRIPGLERYRGILPIGLTVDPERRRLLIAEAGINAVGIVDLESRRLVGHVPAAWFPTRVIAHGDSVFVANAKGFGTGPNAGLERSFQADLRKGAITIFKAPADSELAGHTQRVLSNNGFIATSANPLPLPSELRYAVLIVKENRTFDEVFGPGARYGPRVTPNHHAMAKRYAIGDNFYADCEVSVDGHHWLVGSYPNAWTESSLMASYGGQKDFRLPTKAPGRLHFAQSNSSVHPEEQLEAGALWHHLDRNGVSFRNFGEGFELAGADEGEGLKPTGVRLLTNVPMPEPLFRNTSRAYPQFNMNIPDQFRASVLIEELGGLKELPRFLFVHLPNDHADKPRPLDGYPTDESYVADNDIALGRIVEYLSQRPEWKQMAIFVTEDDAQGGVDTVDSHRTLLLTASPWAKPGYVSHRHSSFPGLLKTIFRILGIPPLNLYDAAATDLSDSFAASADYAPFESLRTDPAVFDPSKAKEPRDPKPSVRMDDPAVLRGQHK